MTSLLDRITGSADDLEDAPVTTPMPFTPAVPGTSTIVWWFGIPGLDPDIRVAPEDWLFAAECSAMACAAQVVGLDAGRADWWRSAKSAPARKWLEWLLEAQPGSPDMRKRILALRLVCERAAVISDDYILHAAQSLHAACSGMRPR